MEEKKKSKFVIEEGDVKVADKHQPTEDEKKEADRVFDRILKNRKPKK